MEAEEQDQYLHRQQRALARSPSLQQYRLGLSNPPRLLRLSSSKVRILLLRKVSIKITTTTIIIIRILILIRLIFIINPTMVTCKRGLMLRPGICDDDDKIRNEY